MRRERRERDNVEAYLCESALVQNILLEPRDFQRGYAARASPTGGPEEGGVAKEPGRMTSEEGIIGRAHVPATALM